MSDICPMCLNELCNCCGICLNPECEYYFEDEGNEITDEGDE